MPLWKTPTFVTAFEEFSEVASRVALRWQHSQNEWNQKTKISPLICTWGLRQNPSLFLRRRLGVVTDLCLLKADLYHCLGKKTVTKALFTLAWIFLAARIFFSQVWIGLHLMFLDKFHSNPICFLCVISQWKKWNSNWSWIARHEKIPRKCEWGLKTWKDFPISRRILPGRHLWTAGFLCNNTQLSSCRFVCAGKERFRMKQTCCNWELISRVFIHDSAQNLVDLVKHAGDWN